MQKKWIAGGLLVLGLLGVCGCSSQAFVSEQQTETVLTKEETGWKFQDGTYQMIAKKRHSRMRHLHPDLMESSRFQLHFQKCPVSLTCQTFPG